MEIYDKDNVAVHEAIQTFILPSKTEAVGQVFYILAQSCHIWQGKIGCIDPNNVSILYLIIAILAMYSHGYNNEIALPLHRQVMKDGNEPIEEGLSMNDIYNVILDMFYYIMENRNDYFVQKNFMSFYETFTPITTSSFLSNVRNNKNLQPAVNFGNHTRMIDLVNILIYRLRNVLPYYYADVSEIFLSNSSKRVQYTLREHNDYLWSMTLQEQGIFTCFYGNFLETTAIPLITIAFTIKKKLMVQSQSPIPRQKKKEKKKLFENSSPTSFEHSSATSFEHSSQTFEKIPSLELICSQNLTSAKCWTASSWIPQDIGNW